MPNLNELANEVKKQKDKLAENLSLMGVTAETSETLNTLVPKVLTIKTGLSDEDLLKADATVSDVLYGKTFYSKDRQLKTGNALSESVNVTASKMFTGTTAYNQQGVRITGSPTVTTATAAKIAKGKTAYTNDGRLLTGTGTIISGTAYKVYTGELTSYNTTVYLDNIAFAFIGSDLTTGVNAMATAGGYANDITNFHVQIVVGTYGQVISAGFLTITSSYIRWEPDIITSMDYMAFCEV